ncbi:hypothetical protein [Brevibacillus formosus]|uniref:hypothetical protein n=1 Tax=Brevibacillus formosus TaxID=54913 RepID=UPI003F1C97EF
MTVVFNERAALGKTLSALLEQRTLWRSEYVARDKVLGSEIKEILNRIRELDELHGSPIVMHEEETEAEQIATEVSTTGQFVDQSQKIRRQHQRHDYSRISQEIEGILEESSPVAMPDLYKELQQRLRVDWPNPYITIHRALEHSERIHVQKIGRKLMFSLQVVSIQRS